MEILLFIMDALVFAVMVCMSVRDERRPAGRSPTNLFRMRVPPPPAVDPPTGRHR